MKKPCFYGKLHLIRKSVLKKLKKGKKGEKEMKKEIKEVVIWIIVTAIMIKAVAMMGREGIGVEPIQWGGRIAGAIYLIGSTAIMALGGTSAIARALRRRDGDNSKKWLKW